MSGSATRRVGSPTIPVAVPLLALSLVVALVVFVLWSPTLHAQTVTPGKPSVFTVPPGPLVVDATSSSAKGASIAAAGDECAAADGVCIFENTWYGGRWVRFTGTGCYADFNQIAFNDLTSSIRFGGSYAGGGYEAVLYEHSNYAGISSAFRVDDPDLTNDAIGNDRASSICVNPVPATFCPTITAWKGEYWNNTSLSGLPALCRNDPNVNFDWGAGGPGGGVGVDNFSTRWTRDQYFAAGRYRFHVAADDGVRLWVDGSLVIDQWRDQARTEYTVDRDLGAGNHNLRVEYYENLGNASISLWWDQLSSNLCPTITAWKGEYWNNRDLAGAPTLCQNDAAVNFDWGLGGPGGGIGVDNFSARWTRDLYFPAGTYRFHLAGDDGVRLWINNTPFINQWQIQSRTEYTALVGLAAGNYSVRVEYFEAAGQANVSLWWESVSGDNCPTITDWKGEYWNNRYLSGGPVLCQNNAAVNFNWGTGGPGGGVGVDNFSARWTRNLNFAAGRYRFHLAGDDGVRLWVDGALVIDQWHDQARTEYTVERDLTAGSHSLKVEYYENLGEASVSLWWDTISTSCLNAEYFNNRYLSGSPTFTQCEAWPIDHNWGAGGPGNGVGVDNFSARWTSRTRLNAGTYTFVARADDGVRVWVGGNLLIDAWRDQPPTEYRRTVTLAAGDYDMRVEYYEALGGAVAQVWWEQVGGASGVVTSNMPAFDTCRLPTAAEMQTWWNNSPYYEANLYLGGASRACNDWNQQSLTPAWLQSVHAQGWNFIPTWVGLQAPCNTNGFTAMSGDANTAFNQGRAEADTAVSAARAVGLTGLGTGKTVIYYSIAPYPNYSWCRSTVQSFMSGWAGRLRELGMRSGGFGASCGSYVSDWASITNVPDNVWPATANWPSYDPNVTVWNATCVSNGLWVNHQRIFQYTPAHNEWWGGIGLTIDSNIADGDVAGTHARVSQATSQVAAKRTLSPDIVSAALVAPDQGWALTSKGLGWSADSGDRWTDITPAGVNAAAIQSVEFLDPLHGWLAYRGPSGLTVAATKDAGRSWTSTPVSAAPSDSDASLGNAYLSFVDPANGWLSVQLSSGSNFSLAALYATQDGGATWTPLSVPVAGPIRFINLATGWVAGGAAGDELYVTRDGGRTWSAQPGLPRARAGSGTYLYGLPSFQNEAEGVIPVTVAEEGSPRIEFYRTTDGGASWQLAAGTALSRVPATAVATAIVQGRVLFAADPANGELQTGEGRSLQAAPGEALKDAAQVDFATPSSGWAVRRYGTCQGDKNAAGQPFSCEQHGELIRTQNGGATWELLRP